MREIYLRNKPTYCWKLVINILSIFIFPALINKRDCDFFFLVFQFPIQKYLPNLEKTPPINRDSEIFLLSTIIERRESRFNQVEDESAHITRPKLMTDKRSLVWSRLVQKVRPQSAFILLIRRRF